MHRYKVMDNNIGRHHSKEALLSFLSRFYNYQSFDEKNKANALKTSFIIIIISPSSFFFFKNSTRNI